MKYKALWKDTRVEIKKSIGRFLSIFLIVAIGVAFFAGVKASAPTMKHSADAYYDTQNLMDIKVMSTLGLRKNDIAEMEKIDGVESVYASHSMDALLHIGATQSVVKIMSMPLHAKPSDPAYVNQPRLLKGRLPKNDKECVVEYDKIIASGINIGDTITLTSGTTTPIQDTLRNSSFQVVGYVNSPYYLSHEKGSSTIGSGTINTYMLIGENNFTSPYYSEAYVIVDGVKDINSYDDAYFDKVDKVTKRLEHLAKEQASLRLTQIKQEANETLNQKIALYEANRQTFESEISNAQATLQNKESELISAQNTLQNAQSEINYQTAQWESKKNELGTNQQILNAKLVEINASIQTITDALQNPQLPFEQAQQLQIQLAQLEAGKAEMENNLQVIATTLTSTPILLQQKQAEIDAGVNALNEGLSQLENGAVELEKNRKEGQEKLDEAKQQIDQAKHEIETMKKPKWYVLDRNSHYSYVDYGSAADRMGAIATVFPVFFFLVAALVCLTSMTRMVDEQRQQIGTLKALGYAKINIAMKYITYAATASVFGGIFGSIVGMSIFPMVIYNAWNIMYTLPQSIRFLWQPDLAILAIVLASLTTIAATLFACYKELSETPSLLMRPKAPKSGKTILLERARFLWKRLSFTQKVTARNLFRYKKRFFMTVIGISGCTALIVSGFGIRDSISQIVNMQFNHIYKYDVSLTIKSDVTNAKVDALLSSIKQDKNVESAMCVPIYHGFYREGNEDKGVDLYILNDNEQTRAFYTLKNRQSDKILALNDDGILISEKLAKDQNVSVGDTIQIDNGDGNKQKLKINGIVENYVGHNIYMSPTYYQKMYQSSPKTTSIVALLKDSSATKEEQFGARYMENDIVSSISFFSGVADSFDKTISSLISVVIVLIISAGLLAFVVLYNLTTVNISERMREIATIKVLGFYDREVSSYVYKENILLTIIGSLCGLLLGIALHSMIMDIAEQDNIMFGRNIEPLSFIVSFLITIVFSVCVNLVMYNKLKKIPMVESLKSIE